MNSETSLPFLCELLVKSFAILLAAALVVRAWRGATAAQRHLVWFGAIVTVLVLPCTRLVTPHWSVPVPLERATSIHLTTPDLPSLAPIVNSDTPSDAKVMAPHPRRGWTLPDWRKVLPGIWLGGAALLIGFRLLGSWRLRRLTKASAVLDDVRVREMAGRVLRELNIGPHVEIRLSDECHVPMTWGAWRPVLMLPAEALQWSDVRLITALRHEAGHIHRRDYLVRWITQMACAVYWPNPLAWLAARALRLAQEQATDDLVLRAGTPPDEYAEQLVEAARTVATRGLFVRHAVAMANPSTLAGRVLAIVDGERDRRPLSRRAAAIGSIVVAGVLAVCTAAQLQGDEQAPPAESKTPAAASAKPTGPQIEIEAKFVELDPDSNPVDLPPGVPAHGAVYSDPQWQLVWRALHQKKGVDIISPMHVTTRSNQRATLAATREFSSASAWEKTPPDASPQGWHPKTFARKDIGATLDVTPEIKADGSIEMRLQPSTVDFLGFVDLDSGRLLPNKKDKGKYSDGVPVPSIRDALGPFRLKAVFSERQADQKVTLHSEETVALSELKETGDVKAFEKTVPSRQLFVFVSVRVINPPEKPEAAATPAKTSTGSTTIVADAPPGNANPPATLTLSGGTLTVTSGANLVFANTAESAALKKAEKIIVPKVELREASVADALDFLRIRAAQLDPEKSGVNLVLKPGTESEARITLSLTDVPLIEAVRYVASLANLELVTESKALVLQPPGSGAPEANQVTTTSVAVGVPVTLSVKKAFQGNDGIEIREVSGNSPTFHVGGTYRVRGVCRQDTIANASLYLGVTAEGEGDAIKAAPGASLSKLAPKGFTEFEFSFTPLRPGKLHVTLYDLDNHDPKDNAGGGLFLGTVFP